MENEIEARLDFLKTLMCTICDKLKEDMNEIKAKLKWYETVIFFNNKNKINYLSFQVMGFVFILKNNLSREEKQRTILKN